jgi:hypothetical protein
MPEESTNENENGERIVGLTAAAAYAHRSIGFLRRLVQRGAVRSQRNERGEHTFSRRLLEALRPDEPAPAEVAPTDPPEASPVSIVVQPEPAAPSPAIPAEDAPAESAPAEAVRGDDGVTESIPASLEDLQRQLEEQAGRVSELMTLTIGWVRKLHGRIAACEEKTKAVEQRLPAERQKLEEKIAEVRDAALVRADLVVLVETIVDQMLPVILRDGQDLRLALGQLATWLRIPWSPPPPTLGLDTAIREVAAPPLLAAPPVDGTRAAWR